jgi:hypothetical protein
MKLLDANIHRGTTTLVFRTPKGGFDGTSRDDLNDAAGTAFAAAYGKVHYPANETMIVVRGGLVSTATGRDLPNVNTAIYTMTKRQAAKVAWDNEDAVKYTID